MVAVLVNWKIGVDWGIWVKEIEDNRTIKERNKDKLNIKMNEEITNLIVDDHPLYDI